MLSKIKAITLNGLDGNLIEVQTDISNGIPEFDIIGLPDVTVKEAKKRIKSAINNSKIEFPNRKILINLAPANIKKEGSSFDLAMAVGILIAKGDVVTAENNLVNSIFIGELSLDGKVNRINGVLPMCIEAKDLGIKTIILPKANANEAAIISELDIIPVSDLNEVIEYLNKKKIISKYVSKNVKFKENYQIDFSEVKGQENVKRALEIAAAGGHNCLMIGGPGSGKTMMAKRLVTILPELTIDEAMEITKIHSIAGELKRDGLIMNRPFRMPHHTVPISTVIGGGKIPRPGEISMAHCGILFFDELPEFSRSILESLREPLENKEIIINRLSGNYRYPCNFMFVASMNPCPCGNYGDEEKECKCTEQEIHRYLRKVSGPLLDRIDIQIEVKRPNIKSLKSQNNSETSFQIRERVNRARRIQLNRYKEYGIYSNSELNEKLIDTFCSIDKNGEILLKNAFEKLKLSVRAYQRILKVARTIADLEESKDIQVRHLAEAIQYRSLDKFIK